jgi:hypothetical protein
MFSSLILSKADVLSSCILMNAGIAELVSTIAHVRALFNSTGLFNKEDIGNVRGPVGSSKPDSLGVQVTSTSTSDSLGVQVTNSPFIMEAMNDYISRIYRE